VVVGGDRKQVGERERLVQRHRGAEGEAGVGVAERVADRLQPGRDRAGGGQIPPHRVGHLPERQDRGDWQGGVRVDPGGHAGQQPRHPQVGLRVAQGAERPVPGRRHDDHGEGAVVPDEDGVGEIAEIAPWPRQHRRIRRVGHAIAPLEVAAVVDQPTARGALGDRAQPGVRQPGRRPAAAAGRVHDQVGRHRLPTGQDRALHVGGVAARQRQPGHPAARAQVDRWFGLDRASQRRLEHRPPTADGGQVLVPGLRRGAGQEPELLDLDRPGHQQIAVDVGRAVTEQPPAKAEEVVGLPELRHAGPLPALEHPGGVASRRVGVAFQQHHLMTSAAGG
jgi:hypothetical protein